MAFDGDAQLWAVTSKGMPDVREGGMVRRLRPSAPSRCRITRLDVFEIDDVDAALARFAELRPDSHGGPQDQLSG